MFKIFKFSMMNNLRMFWIVLSIIILTITITALLGSAIENMQETGLFAPEKVAVYNNLDDPYKEEFLKVLDSEDFDNLIEVIYIDATENIEELLNDEIYKTIVICESINGHNTITVNSVLAESMMLSIASNFSQTSNVITFIIDNEPQRLENLMVSYNSKSLNTISLPKGSPTGVDYYGIVTLLQISCLLSILSIYSVLDDKIKNVFPRIVLAPLAKWKIIFGRMIADTLFVWVVMILTAVASSLTLGVNWIGNTYIILLAFLSFSIIVVLLGMIAAKLTKTVIGSLGIVLGIGSVIWPRYSGAFSPYQSVSNLSYIAPNFHLKNILFAALYSESTTMMYESFDYVLAIIVVMFGVYMLLERRKNHEHI